MKALKKGFRVSEIPSHDMSANGDAEGRGLEAVVRCCGLFP